MTIVPYFLMSPGFDPNFFPASEAAEAFAADDSASSGRRSTGASVSSPSATPSCPERTTSGFVLTNLDEGVKLVQVDLVASGRSENVLDPHDGARLPGRLPRKRSLPSRDVYPAEKIVDYTDDTAFRAALEALPCCATNKDGSRNGDPLNLVVVGGFDDAFPALVRRGWRPTEEKWLGSIMKMVKSAFLASVTPMHR